MPFYHLFLCSHTHWPLPCLWTPWLRPWWGYCSSWRRLWPDRTAVSGPGWSFLPPRSPQHLKGKLSRSIYVFICRCRSAWCHTSLSKQDGRVMVSVNSWFPDLINFPIHPCIMNYDAPELLSSQSMHTRFIKCRQCLHFQNVDVGHDRK